MYPTELGTPKSEHFLHEEVPLALELFQGGVLFGTPRVSNWRGPQPFHCCSGSGKATVRVACN